MPRRISDYPDAFTGWNLVSSFGSIISVVATALFLYVVYDQLVEGKYSGKFHWYVPEYYHDFLQILLGRIYIGLEWCLNSPPKPHAFASLPLTSMISLRGLLRHNMGPLSSTKGSEIESHWRNFTSELDDEKKFDMEVGLYKKLDLVAKDFIATNVEQEEHSINKYYERLEDLATIKSDNCKNFIINRLVDLNNHIEYGSQRLIKSILEVKYLQDNGFFKPGKVMEGIERARENARAMAQITDVSSNLIESGNNNTPGTMIQSRNNPPFNPFRSDSDTAMPWGLYFQDSGSPQMEAIVELHNNIMFYLFIILFSVGWILLSIVRNYTYNKHMITNKYSNHGTLIELIWTITPALILILIAFPSFKLLYLMDEVTDPNLTLAVEGHQWYWTYEYADFINDDEEFIEYDSYIVPESDLELGAFRLLEVDNRIILPELTHTRFMISAADVIHSFACPSLGIKCDAYPGRLNQVSVHINREGIFHGQCSEICGILHSSMPISIQSVSLEKFLLWLYNQ